MVLPFVSRYLLLFNAEKHGEPPQNSTLENHIHEYSLMIDAFVRCFYIIPVIGNCQLFSQIILHKLSSICALYAKHKSLRALRFRDIRRVDTQACPFACTNCPPFVLCTRSINHFVLYAFATFGEWTRKRVRSPHCTRKKDEAPASSQCTFSMIHFFSVTIQSHAREIWL